MTACELVMCTWISLVKSFQVLSKVQQTWTLSKLDHQACSQNFGSV